MEAIETGLDIASRLLGGRLVGPVIFGWHQKSAGRRIFLNTGEEFWLRVQFSSDAELNTRLWDGEKTAPMVQEITRPKTERVIDWKADAINWRATLMEFISESSCSATPHLDKEIQLTESWWKHLTLSLHTLKRIKTNRACVRQDLVTRRISERYGSYIDSNVENWVACHGDFHWRNITSQTPVIFDWEAWGVAIAGFDEAMLLAYAGKWPATAQEVAARFGSILHTRDGRIATLFVCAELLRMIEWHGDHPELRPSLEELAQKVLRNHQNQ